MIITLKGADFSQSNIGTLNTYSIINSIGVGALYNGPTFVSKGGSLSANIQVFDGYAINAASIQVVMGGVILPNAISINGNRVVITIAQVTAPVYISASTTVAGPTGAVLVNDFTGVQLGGGSYGKDGIMFAMKTNIPAGTYVSHIDMIATQGISFTTVVSPITTGPITVHLVNSSNKVSAVLASVNSATSFLSDKSETLGYHIYRININKAMTETTNLAITLNPADTTTAPTAAYGSGGSPTLGSIYMGNPVAVGSSITYNQSNYFLPCVIYG